MCRWLFRMIENEIESILVCSSRKWCRHRIQPAKFRDISTKSVQFGHLLNVDPAIKYVFFGNYLLPRLKYFCCFYFQSLLSLITVDVFVCHGNFLLLRENLIRFLHPYQLEPKIKYCNFYCLSSHKLFDFKLMTLLGALWQTNWLLLLLLVLIELNEGRRLLYISQANIYGPSTMSKPQSQPTVSVSSRLLNSWNRLQLDNVRDNCNGCMWIFASF